jgi:formylglycine-generating enzyme required for sulfatase activity
VVPALDEVVEVPAGAYRLGEPGEERVVQLGSVRIGRWPVANALIARFAEATGRPLSPKLTDSRLEDHPATDLTLLDAKQFCAWATDTLGARVRLPTAQEWEAAARGTDERPYPWGETFDEARCNCAEAGWGWTVPVTAHPGGAGPFGTQQQAGNVWEWVAGTGADGWGTVRGGSHLDHAWGVRTSRVLPADPLRPTPTTGFRIAVAREERA